MCRTTGAETETRLRKSGVKDRREHLGNGLLDQPVKNGGDAQRAEATLGFGISTLRTGFGR